MTQYITVAADDRIEAKSGIIKLHGPDGFEGMRRAGRLAAEILDALVPHVVPGVSTQELDDIVHKMTLDAGGVPATPGEGPRPSATAAIPRAAASRSTTSSATESRATAPSATATSSTST